MSSPPPSSPTGSPYKRPGVARHAARSEPLERDDDDPPVPPEIRRSARAIQIIVMVLALIGLGVVGAFGGFERAGIQQGTPAVPVRQEFNAGIFQITVDGAVAAAELRRASADDGNLMLEIDARISNTGDQTASLLDLFKLEGVELVDSSARTLFIRDDTQADEVQPGLPERIAFLWEVKGSTVPATVNLTVTGTYARKTYIRIFNEVREFRGQSATLTVPVVRTGATP